MQKVIAVLLLVVVAVQASSIRVRRDNTVGSVLGATGSGVGGLVGAGVGGNVANNNQHCSSPDCSTAACKGDANQQSNSGLSAVNVAPNVAAGPICPAFCVGCPGVGK